jgi:hypothetical protein
VLVGFIVLTTCEKNSNYTSIGGLFIARVGFSTPLALLFAVAQLATPPHLLGLTTGQLIASRASGQAISAAIPAPVYQSKIKRFLPGDVTPAVTAAGLPSDSVSAFISAVTAGDTAALQSLTSGNGAIITAGMNAATTAYVDSFHYGWYTALPFSIVALLIVFLLSGKTIKAQMTWLVRESSGPNGTPLPP